MLYYLDTVIVIYAVEGNPADQQRALNHLEDMQTPKFCTRGNSASRDWESCFIL